MKQTRSIKAGRAADAVVTYIVLIVVAAFFFFPCIWLILASFSETSSLYTIEGFFPDSYSFQNYKDLFTDTAMYDYPRWFGNTFFVAFMSCVLGTFLTILTAYCMSRFKFRSRKALMKTTLVLGMFPSFMAMTAVFLLMTQFSFVNNLWGLVLIYSAGAPMGYMVQKGFFDTIPSSIDEAARLDGATNFQVFCRSIMPISKPILVYTALTPFTWPWSDYILPKLLLPTMDNWTVAVGLMYLDETEFSRFAAGSIFIGVPIVVLYFCLVKYMVNGLSAGAVKD